ncbi:MAG: GNAT family N-acetyltransferase [Trueperaceae bacterium]|nr:MAG: GNAT family N-acetyltransferase [Trueperaceae bacterium]
MRGTYRSLDFVVVGTEFRHCQGVYDTIRLANGIPLEVECPTCIRPKDVREQITRFPEGQFVAVITENGEEKVIGAATLMRTDYPPTAPPLPWKAMIGTKGLANHDPDGRWLYGVEIAVRPAYQRRGVASALYRARLGLVEKIGLRGWYAGGVLFGYHRYRKQMSPREYGWKVIRHELYDPTVTMQLNQGLEAMGVIENYYPESRAGNAAVLIVWQPDGKRAVQKRGKAAHTRPDEARL